MMETNVEQYVASRIAQIEHRLRTEQIRQPWGREARGASRFAALFHRLRGIATRNRAVVQGQESTHTGERSTIRRSAEAQS
jgi:hypothetical protein